MVPRKIEGIGVHLEFSIRLYRYQMQHGPYVLHEHPATASSWRVPSVEALSRSPLVSCIVSDMCAFGMHAGGDGGEIGPFRKPTRFMSNSQAILRRTNKTCPGCPRHIPLLGGKAKHGAVYPGKLCQLVCQGFGDQMELDYWDMMTIPLREPQGAVDVDSLWGGD